MRLGFTPRTAGWVHYAAHAIAGESGSIDSSHAGRCTARHPKFPLNPVVFAHGESGAYAEIATGNRAEAFIIHSMGDKIGKFLGRTPEDLPPKEAAGLKPLIDKVKSALRKHAPKR
jgi:hypothetical protein